MFPGAEIAVINPRRKKKHHRRHRSHAKRRTYRARRRHSTVIVARRINPKRHKVRHYFKRRYRHRVRNPRFSVGGITKALVPAAIGGAGGVALDIALGYATFLPAQLTTGYGKVATQIAGAFGLGWAAGKVLGHVRGQEVTLGALTVALYSLIKTTLKTAAPTLPGLAGDYESMRMGAYIPPSLGFTNAAPSLSGLGAFMRDTGTMSGFDGLNDGM